MNPDEIPCGPAKTSEEMVDRIDINDLADCVKIIDMCSERGAFKGNELHGVGELRNRLVAFVNAVVEAKNEEDGIDDIGEPPESETPDDSGIKYEADFE